MKSYYNSKNKEIEKDQILYDLKYATVAFEKGKNVEARNILLDVVIAIHVLIDN